MTAGTGTMTLGVAMATSTTFFALGASSIISAAISFAASFTSSTTATATATATSEGSETATDSLDSVVISLDSAFVFDEFFAHVTFLSYRDSNALA